MVVKFCPVTKFQDPYDRKTKNMILAKGRIVRIVQDLKVQLTVFIASIDDPENATKNASQHALPQSQLEFACQAFDNGTIVSLNDSNSAGMISDRTLTIAPPEPVLARGYICALDTIENTVQLISQTAEGYNVRGVKYTIDNLEDILSKRIDAMKFEILKRPSYIAPARPDSEQTY